MGNIHQVEHPLLKHSLTILRNNDTATEEFRHHTAIVSQIMIMEATKNVSIDKRPIETPLTDTTGYEINRSIIFVLVLRAGISMLFPAREFLPWASVGFIGLERDENTAVAREYYQKFPADLADKQVMVLDPMLATGGSICDTIEALINKGARRISAVCIVGAPEGIRNLQERHPEVRLFIAAIDSHLDENRYIVPGLGDFGDRYFGT